MNSNELAGDYYDEEDCDKAVSENDYMQHNCPCCGFLVCKDTCTFSCVCCGSKPCTCPQSVTFGDPIYSVSIDDVPSTYIISYDPPVLILNNPPKKALITGVTGQDGSYLADLLLGKGYTVFGLARRTSNDNTQRITHLLDNDRFILVEGDVTDYYCLYELMREENFDEVYNLAAQSHVATSFKQPKLTWDVVAGGCMNLLNIIVSLKRDKGHETKFYQASSSEMFGDMCTAEYSLGNIMKRGELIPCEKVENCIEKFQDESTPMNPQSPYSIAKLAAHHMVRLYRESYGIQAASGILFNHCGERRGEKFVTRKITKWLGEFSKWKRNVEAQENGMTYEFGVNDNICSIRNNPNKEPYGHNDSWLYGPQFPKLKLGNLDACRDWSHAEDAVRAMWLMLQQDTMEDFVVGSGETHTVKDFLEEAFKCIGIENYMDYVVIDEGLKRPAEVSYLRANPKKAKEKLGWVPEIDLPTLVKRMVDHDGKE